MKEEIILERKIGGKSCDNGISFTDNNYLVKAYYNDNNEIKVDEFELSKYDFLKGPFFDNFFFSPLTKLLNRLLKEQQIEEEIYGDKTFEKLDIDKKNIAIILLILFFVFFNISFFIIPLTFSYMLSLFSFNSLISYNFGVLLSLLLIFYVCRTSQSKESFQYHSAEHMVDNAFKQNKELTIENVKMTSAIHKKCGSNFFTFQAMLYCIFTSIMLVLDNVYLQIGLGLFICLAITSISFFLYKYIVKNKYLNFILFIPLLFQRLTLLKPTDKHIDIAIRAYTTLLNKGN